MLRGIYGSAAAMIAQQQRQEMLTNNLANANTPGFKADAASIRAFPNMLIQATNTSNMPPNRSLVGTISTGAYIQEKTPNFLQGDIVQTENTTDIALLQGVIPRNEEGRLGALFLSVEDEAGNVRYTRNGNLTVDGQGFLTTAEGYYVLGANGERFAVGNEFFTIDQTGTIVANNGTTLGQLQVAFAADPMTLVKEGNGLFRLEGEAALPSAIGNGAVSYQINQGFIERSNVDATQTMTEMMQAYRTFEANQKVLQAYDRSLEKAVTEIGRIG